jgi:2OG-Fe(II) oxygenase superfamily
MIILKPHDVVVDPVGLERLREEYQNRHCVLITKLLDDTLLSVLRPLITSDSWREFIHEGIGSEVVLRGQTAAVTALHFATNSPKFLAAIAAITGRDDLTWFGGRVFRMSPDAGHYDSWHDDVRGNRQVGMSINLSDGGYEGGLFELRDRATELPLAQIANTQLGGASLFRISKDLQHRVSPITGTRARTAFAGWFCSGEPDFMSRLHQLQDEGGGH